MLDTVVRRAGPAVAGVALALLLAQLARAAWLFARHAWAAVTYPYPLDYGEGPILDQALRLARLENIYRADLSAPPFLVANYPPLFPLLQAPLVAALGPSLWYGRAFSTLSVALAAILVGLTLRVLTRDSVAALAGGLALLSFPYVVHWSAFNRVDSLALALCCAALLAAARAPRTRLGLAVVALLLTAAIFTRQSYALAAPLAAFVFLTREAPRRRAFELAGMVAAGSLALLLALQLLTGGGFLFHIVSANVNPFHPRHLVNRAKELAEHLPALLGVGGLFLALGAWRRPASWWLVAPFLVGAAASALTIGKEGSNVNYLYELCAALSLVAGALLAWARERPWLRAALALVLAWQVGASVAWTEEVYAPRVLERVAARAEVARLMTVVEGAGGPVLADEYMGLLPLAGQPIVHQPFEMKQLADAKLWDERALTERIEAREFALILIYDPPDWNSFDERWTGRQRLYILTEYAPAERIADTVVYRPLR
jgi:hypothetical protein